MKKALYISAFLASSTLLSMPALAAQTLTATLGQYPDSSLTAPTGTVSVSFNQTLLVVAYDMEKIAPSSQGGLHIHAGTSCADAEKVGGHYWSATLGEDTWKGITWKSDAQGEAEGILTLKTGYGYDENLSHAVVVHNAEGTRIACGVLQPTE